MHGVTCGIHSSSLAAQRLFYAEVLIPFLQARRRSVELLCFVTFQRQVLQSFVKQNRVSCSTWAEVLASSLLPRLNIEERVVGTQVKSVQANPEPEAAMDSL